MANGASPAFDGRRRARAFVAGLGDAALVATHAAVLAGALAGPALAAWHTFGDGGAAWRHVFFDAESWKRWPVLVGNSVAAAGVAVAVALAAGVPLATVLFRTDVRWRPGGVALLLLAAAMPVHVWAGACLSMIRLDSIKDSVAAVGWIHGLAHLPVATLIVGLSLRGVGRQPEEAALAAGASVARTVGTVSLPLAAGGLVAAALLVALWTTTDYTISDLLLVRTFAEEVYTQYQLHGRPEEPALVALPQAILFAALLGALRDRFLTGGWAEDDGSAGSGRVFAVRRARGLISIGVFLAAATPALAPVVALAGRVRGLGQFVRLAGGFRHELVTSVATSVSAGALAGFFGLGLAWWLVRRRWWRGLIAAGLVILLAIPGPVLGISLILLLNRPGPLGALYSSPVVLVLAFLFRFLPVAVILMVPAVRAIPAEQELVARADGAGEAAIWRRLLWPQCAGAALLAAFAVTALSMGEVACSQLVAPPGYLTVGLRLFSLLHYGLYPDVATLCLLSLALVVGPWAGLLLLLRHRLL